MSDLLKLAELRERATAGPWEQSCGRTCEAVVAVGRECDSAEQVRYDGSPVADCDTSPHCGTTESQNEANAAYIAAAGSLTPARLRELAGMEARLVALEAERQWRPIAEAPKDGTLVLGLIHQYNREAEPMFYAVVYFDAGLEIWQYDLDDSEAYTPTFWQPLPSPPKPNP